MDFESGRQVSVRRTLSQLRVEQTSLCEEAVKSTSCRATISVRRPTNRLRVGQTSLGEGAAKLFQFKNEISPVYLILRIREKQISPTMGNVIAI